jgi:cob(I)alamin adenosyltransferase
VAESVKSIEKGDYKVVAKGQVDELSALIEVVKSHLYNIET